MLATQVKIIVSIHAPVRERLTSRCTSGNKRGFNSRSRKGATIADKFYNRLRIVSIHAPVRERPQDSINSNRRKCFNSRSRKGATKVIFCSPYGRDESRLPAGYYSTVSIHAPVRERRVFVASGTFINSFNSRSRKGATLLVALALLFRQFQFTLP